MIKYNKPMKKNYKTILISLIVIFILTISFWSIKITLLNKANKKTNTPQSNKTQYVQLDNSFILNKNQKAVISEENLEVKITHFVNSPCPKGSQCVWSGLGITFEYSYNGKTESGLNLTQAFGYEVKVIDTDYETFAKIKVNKIK